LSDYTPEAKFLATPLLGAIGVLIDLDWIPRPTTCLHNHFLENAGQAQFKFSHWDFSFGEVTNHRQNAFSLNCSKVSHFISLAPLMFDSEKVLETLEGMVYFSRLDRFVILCANVTLTHTHSDVWLVFNVQNLEWNFFMKSQIKFLILKN